MAVLYHVPTSRSLRVLWTLEEIGATVEVKSLGVRPRLQEPEYLAINPAGTLPGWKGEAPAGGILISRNVRDAVAGRVKATFEDLGGLR